MTHVLVELPGEDGITIMDEEAVAMVCGNRLAQLLHSPLRRGMCGDVAVDNTPRRVFHQDKDIEQAKGRGDHHAEVTGDDRLGMIADKRLPALGGGAVASARVEALWHVFPYGAR